jgi:acetyltransferase
MTVYNLDKLFEPKTICIVTVDGENENVGAGIAKNLERGEFDGHVSTVAYNTKKLFGRSQRFSSFKRIKQPVDLVVTTASASNMIPIIEESAAIGAGAIIITASYGKAANAGNRELGTKIHRIAEQSGIRIIGPNSNGVISRRVRMNASLIHDMPLPGKIALISQSGSIGASILDLSFKKRMGFSYYVGLGSMLDVEFGDLIYYLGGDPKVSSIVMYAENLVRFRNFMGAARKVSRIKPIIALKAGRTPGGALAATAHTGENAGDDRVYDEAFERAGIVRVKTFEELFDCAELLAKQQRPSGTGLAIVTNAGGPGVMAADALSDYGADPVSLSPDIVSELDDVLPSEWSRNNPIDILGDADPQRYCRTIEICQNSPDIHAFLIIYSPQGPANSDHVAEALTQLLKQNTHIIFVSWMGGDRVEKSCEILNKAGIPTFDTPERAVRAFMDLYRYAKNLEMLQEIPPKLPRKLSYNRDSAQTIIQRTLKEGGRWLSTDETDALLGSYGICRLEEIDASSPENFLAQGTDETVALTDDIREPTETIIQKQDVALCIGAMTDRCFGPVIIFGHGNGMPENFNSLSISLPPLNRLLARRLMEKSEIFSLLRSSNHFSSAHFTFLEELLTRISQLVTDFAEIDTLIVNPLYLSKRQASAAVYRIHVSPASVQAPMHLVISAYPNQYENEVVLENVDNLLIRPIKPEDAPLLSDLFDSLSPQTIYFRFFTPLKSLPHSMLSRFTQIDYDREIALVAIQDSKSKERMLGVSRVILGRGQESAEFAILVSDQWQGKGIGAELLKQCLAIAKERNIQEVYGIVLAENTTMLALGRKLGFDMKITSGGQEYELRISPSRIFSEKSLSHERQN